MPALPAGAVSADASEKQAAVSRLIQAYALRGHQIADIDPLGLMQRPTPSVLKLDYFDLTEADMDHEFVTGDLAGTTRMKLRDIVALLRRIYCGNVGAEFAHMSRSRERLWIKEQFESGMVSGGLTKDEKLTLLTRLTAAEGIERYLHTRYVGQKRFSLEGGGSLIPMLDDVIQQGGAGGVEDIVIGMAHRGRINVLVNVLGKSPEVLFSEFEGKYDEGALKGSGDVKYHMGFSSDIRTAGGNVHVVLAFNPSHLEIVNPVVEGSVRARQNRRGDTELRWLAIGLDLSIPAQRRMDRGIVPDPALVEIVHRRTLRRDFVPARPTLPSRQFHSTPIAGQFTRIHAVGQSFACLESMQWTAATTGCHPQRAPARADVRDASGIAPRAPVTSARFW